MILRHLRYFSAVAEHGSMVAAARALRVAQPSLSRQIGALERQIGVLLFERTRRGIRLTPPGSVLLSGARVIDERLAQALRRARLAHEGKLGTIRVGLSRGAVESSRVGRAIAALRNRLPDVALEVSEVGSFTHVEALLANTVDAAICLHSSIEQPRGIRRELFFAEPVECVLLPATHPLANNPVIKPADLRSERLMVIDPTISGGFPELHAALRALHEDGPIETHETVDSIYSLVAAGRGWTPAMTALKGHAPAGTVVVPLEGLRVDVVMGVSWRAADRSLLVANVIDALREASCESNGVVTEPTRSCEPTVELRVPRGLESRHLRALAVTVAEGSVARAAVRLGLTTSGLSRQLRTLEQELGTPLFTRGSGGTAANPAGQVLSTEAAEILTMIDDMFVQIRGSQRGSGRACRIGAVPPEMSGDLVLHVVRHVERNFPELTIEIADMLTTSQISALLSHHIDIGVAGAYPGLLDDPLIASVRVGEDALECALLATSHPLASRAWLTPADLSDIPFLFIPRPTHPRLYDTVMSVFDQIGLTPRIEGSFNGPRTIWRLAADSMGWSLGNRHHRTSPPAGLVAIPVEGLRIPAGIQLLWRRDEGDPSIKAVLDVFRRSGTSNAEI